MARLAERDRIELRATGDLAAFARAASRLAGVDSADTSDGTVQLIASEGRHLLPAVLDLAERNGATVSGVLARRVVLR